MILPVYVYGQPVLRKVAEDITPDYPNLKELIQNMFETMDHADGVGLAAPQIGLPIRVVVVDLDVLSEDYPEYKGFRKAYINAHILEVSGVVVPPVVVGEGGVTVAAYVGLAAHRRTAVVVDLLGARRDCVVSGPASRTAGCVLVGGVRAAPLDRSVGIAADEGVHLRIPALLRGVDYDADTVLVAVVGAEEVVRAVADGS